MNLILKIVVIALLGVAASCSKISKEDRTEIEGSYEWFYSFDGGTESNSFQSIGDKYAIKIKKNGKVLLYENGSELKKGNLESVIDIQNVTRVSVKWDKWSSEEFEIDNGQIVFENWPFETHTNYFSQP